MRATPVGIGILSFALGAGSAAGQVASEDVNIRLNGRVQVQFNTTSVSPEEAGVSELPASTFETRRVRLGARVTIREWIEAVIEPEFALGDFALRLAFVNLAFEDWLNLRIGQYKKPFGRIFLESSTQIQAIERGLRIRGLAAAEEREDLAAPPPRVLTFVDGTPLLGEEQFILDALLYQSYDIGTSLHGTTGRLFYEVGVFNGSGLDRRDENDWKTVAARVGGQPFEGVPLSIGGAVTRQDRFEDPESGVAVELFGEWSRFRERGLHVIGEVVMGGTIVVDDTFLGAQVVASWFAPVRGKVEGIEPVARVSYGDPRRDIDGDAGVLLTPGVNVYFFGRNRLSLNLDVYVPQGNRFETASSLRAQASAAF
jgi:hypothetical protein